MNVRGLVGWQLVRQVRLAGSRRDHYEAATDFWRVMLEIMERRFRWNLRQVVAAADETARLLDTDGPHDRADFIARRLTGMRDFFVAVDAGISGLTPGEAFSPKPLQRAMVRIPVEDDDAATAPPRRATRSRRTR